MPYLIIKVEIHDLALGLSIPSLVFTEQGDHEYARKLAAYHIFHLHRDDQKTFSSTNVQFSADNEIIVDEKTKITSDIVGMTDVVGIHKLGGLGLFGYNKKLRFYRLRFSLM